MEPAPYVTVEDASAYLAGRPNAKPWDEATPEGRLGALSEASDRIDALMYKGLPLTTEQERPWPRSGVDVSSINVVRRAAILEALALLEAAQDSSGQARAKLQAQGVKSFSNGPLSETYENTRPSSGGLESASAYKILRPYMVTSGRVV